MSPLAFLLLAVVIAVVGTVALWLRQRQPTSIEASIEEFHREMRALAPEDRPGRGPGAGDGTGGPEGSHREGRDPGT